MHGLDRGSGRPTHAAVSPIRGVRRPPPLREAMKIILDNIPNYPFDKVDGTMRKVTPRDRPADNSERRAVFIDRASRTLMDHFNGGWGQERAITAAEAALIAEKLWIEAAEVAALLTV